MVQYAKSMVKLDNNAVFWAVLDNPVEIGRHKDINAQFICSNSNVYLYIAMSI
jgi:hypothetical protein